jgi:magnesium-transporting ATPase (P-type)
MASAVLFAASVVKRGELTGVVTATGEKTFFGKTAKLVDESAPQVHVDQVLGNVVKVARPSPSQPTNTLARSFPHQRLVGICSCCWAWSLFCC